MRMNDNKVLSLLVIASVLSLIVSRYAIGSLALIFYAISNICIVVGGIIIVKSEKLLVSKFSAISFITYNTLALVLHLLSIRQHPFIFYFLLLAQLFFLISIFKESVTDSRILVKLINALTIALVSIFVVSHFIPGYALFKLINTILLVICLIFLLIADKSYNKNAFLLISLYLMAIINLIQIGI